MAKINSAQDRKGWVIARVPSNREFTVHTEVSRPTLDHVWSGSKTDRVRTPIYGQGPECYTPIEYRLARKNQYTRKKRERRTEKPFPIIRGYIFIQDPDTALVANLIERKMCYGLIPDIPKADNNYEPGPIRLTQRAIDHYRARYRHEFDPKTGAGHRSTADTRARMIPGFEFEKGDYVMADDPAWLGRRFQCVEVLDTTARVILSAFGVNHALEFRIDEVRKAKGKENAA